MIKIPKDTVSKVVDYVKSLPPNKALRYTDLPGNNKKAKFEYLKEIEDDLHFNHNMLVVFYSISYPDDKSWNYNTRTYTKSLTEIYLKRIVEEE